MLVSDIRMPGMSGLRGAGAIAGEPAGPAAIILITAFGDEATHARARELGAACVLDKPFELDILCDAIRQVQGP